MTRWGAAFLLLLALLAARPAAAQDVPLVAALSRNDIEVTTGFTGASLVVFGSTAAPIGPGGDEVIIVVRGPTRPVVVRRKVPILGVIWVNGPAARFNEVPGYYLVTGTRPAWQLLPEEERQRNGLGVDALPLTSTGARSPAFRRALVELERDSGLWLEDSEAIEIAGSRLFHVRLPLPAAVPTGDYRVGVLLVRSRRVIATEELTFRVERTGTADRIATVADQQPFIYGIACIVLAALAGWAGSVLFRRG